MLRHLTGFIINMLTINNKIVKNRVNIEIC